MSTIKAFALGLLALGMLSITAAPLAANAAAFQEGINYVPVSPAQPTSVGPGQIEVIEFFWYGCPHCFGVEPYLEAWLKNKPANVVFKRIPAAWPGGEHMDIDAKAFYTAQSLGIGEKIHEPLFNAIHLQNQLNLTSNQDALQKFFARCGTPMMRASPRSASNRPITTRPTHSSCIGRCLRTWLNNMACYSCTCP